jgi:fumarylacetoacetase
VLGFPRAVSGGPTIFAQPALNAFLTLGSRAWTQARAIVSELLDAETPALRDDLAFQRRVLRPQAEVRMHLPAQVGDYTDFYSSREHATNVGTMLRGADHALLPNWLHLPVAYHGRASSLVVSGTPVRRPRGQSMPAGAQAPTFGPTQSLDFELEVGALVGPGNGLGEPVPVARATEHLFGLVLVNDWSARDLQAWEYQPLGPFLAKNFCTGVSPWVVTLEALKPFRRAALPQDPLPLPYLRAPGDWTLDLTLEAHLQTAPDGAPHRITRTNFGHLYWTLAQQVAHHTSNGCALRPGDLLASGTISGPTPESRGCLLELTWRGTQPLRLPGGQTRAFLDDGDRLTLTGWAQGDGYRVGFGTLTGEVVPAPHEVSNP